MKKKISQAEETMFKLFPLSIVNISTANIFCSYSLYTISREGCSSLDPLASFRLHASLDDRTGTWDII